MELGLAGRRAIVTGGSRGIGAAAAAAFAAEGARVAIIGRDVDALHEVVARTGAHQVVADLSTASGVSDGIAACLDALGGVDILVNNAGASHTGSFDDITDADWQESFDLKVMGYVRCMRAVLPHMRAQQRGRIVNVGGTAGVRATPGYVLASFIPLLEHVTRSVAELVGPDGVGVVCLHPGPTLTDRLRSLVGKAAAEAGVDEATFADQRIGASLPLRRVGTAEEVGRMIAILCSDAASWVTGGGLSIDGGAATGIVGG
jgi:3-oxoacyl-[acyl-carrier protein] reductase